MGITAFFYAATGGIDAVEAALRTTFPEELDQAITENRIGTPIETPDLAVLEQLDARDSDGNSDGGARVALWQDGHYTCWAESEVGLGEEPQLLALSAQFGTVLFAMIADHGGSYAFGMFRAGKPVRWLQNDHAFLSGSPIPEEAGIDPAAFSDVDVHLLWERFGLRPCFEGVPPFRVLVLPPRAYV